LIQRRQRPHVDSYASVPSFSAIFTELDRLTPWAKDAACALSDVDFFQESSVHETLKALEVCADCPVRGPCLTYALEANEPAGVWGGATTPERRAALRKHGKGARPALEASFSMRLLTYRRKVAKFAERARRGREKAAQTRRAKTTAA
jgi:WhiB family transcriptional regulator, redox-sensing transcriptional regulator